MKDNVRLKRSLIVQSFAPLFFLLTIKHFDVTLHCELIYKFFTSVKQNGFITLLKVFDHPAFGSLFVSVIGILWLIIALVIALGFNGIQNSGFEASGEKIVVFEYHNDGSAMFLVTYILPLLTDDLSTCRSLVVFVLTLIMIIALLINAKTFFQNPILAALNYKTFVFKFNNPDSDVKCSEKEYVGITRGKDIKEDITVKRKHISDGVFLIYND